MKIKDAVKRTIASNIKRARLAAGMTQADAAKQLNITAQAISNYERGVNGVENSLLLRMCEIYNTSMSVVTGEENEQESSKMNSPTESELSEGEEMLIELFRKVPEDKQQLVLQMIETALRNL